MIAPTAISCPNCGAPLLPAAEMVLCVYCNSAVRLQRGEPGAAPTPVVERSLDETQMARIKQLILDGKRPEAVAEYQQATDADLAEASRTIEELENGLSMSVVLGQQLSPLGWLLFFGSLVIFSGAIFASITGRLNPWLAGLLALLSLANLVFYARNLRTSLQFLSAPVARATVIKLVPIGEVKLGRQLVHTFKVLLQVYPEGAPAYQAEMLLPVRDQNMARLRTGVDFKVKYLRENPQRLVYQD